MDSSTDKSWVGDFGDGGPSQSKTRRRGSSLGERYSTDPSLLPLEQFKREPKSAHRAPHLRKSNLVGPDTIDSLSTVGVGPYHHDGPFDAALLARNTSDQTSPLNALNHSTRETLKATPEEKIMDSVRGHRPLDGTAAYMPGEADRNGHIYDYEEDDNMMITGGNPEGGAYKRWPGVHYHLGDIKGKGEPSYSLEKALKGQGRDPKGRRKSLSDRDIEMSSKPKHAGDSLSNAAGSDETWVDGETPTPRRKTGGLKKKLAKVKNQLHMES